MKHLGIISILGLYIISLVSCIDADTARCADTVAEYVIKIADSSTTYSLDPTEVNCTAYKKVLNEYIDAIHDCDISNLDELIDEVNSLNCE